MSRVRRYRSSWVLPVTVALALSLHGGVLSVYEYSRPEPLPRLVLVFKGKGQGSVVSKPAALSCLDNCSAEFQPGTEIHLVATPAEGSTFEGWSEGCTPRPDWILECKLTLEASTRISIGFGVAPEEVEVAWVETPTDPAAEKELQITLPDPEIEAELLTEPLAEILAEVPPEPPPEPEKQVPPPPDQPPPPEKVAVQMPNLRSVEVPDENEVEEAPDDATHLSDKNRDVAVETRAEDTNLEREQSGDSALSEESDVKSDDVGAKEAEIAQLDDAEVNTFEKIEDEIDRTGRDDKLVGAVEGERGQSGDDGAEGDGRDSPVPGALSMRDIEGRGTLLAKPEGATGAGGEEGRRGKEKKFGIQTELAFEDYERIVGKDKVEEEVAVGRRKRTSKKRGRWEKKLTAVKSALENFTPEVRTGNQTALKTRAAPFAVYIARMHRRIHELWGFGFLDDLDGKPADHPLNDWKLKTVIEIVIEPDGNVAEDKIRIVEHSGRLEFDVAAIDVVLTGGPYEPTPKKIRSPDGRVYIHWGFYRNHRQCGTFNAHAFILSEAPKDSDRANADTELVGKLSRRERKRIVEKGKNSASSGHKGATSGRPSPDDPAANHVANVWYSAFTHRSVDKMLKVTGAPFHSGGAVVANSTSEVGAVYKTVLTETGGAARGWRLLTPAGYRQRFGALPGGIEDGKPQLLMVVQVRKDLFTLVLERDKGGEYKVVGLHR